MHFLKEGQKIRAWVDPPPLFGQCPKENVFFSLRPSLTVADVDAEIRVDNSLVRLCDQGLVKILKLMLGRDSEDEI